MLPQNQKRRVNPLLLKIIVISVGLHVLVALILGGIKVIDHITPDKAQFEEAPETIEEAPPPPPVKIEVKPPKPQQVNSPKLNLRPLSTIALPEVDVDLPDMDQSFTVSSGIGSNSFNRGGGLLGGTFEFGVSNVNVFGVKSKSERIVLVVDSSKNMLTDDKGGLNSYKIIKEKVTEIISNLAPGTLFNVILQGDNRLSLLFQPKLVTAGKKNLEKLTEWFAPINSDENNVGIADMGAAIHPLKPIVNNDMVRNLSQPRDHFIASNQSAYIAQLALEMNADSIFHICSMHTGFHGVKRYLTEEESARYKLETRELLKDPKYLKMLELHNAEIPSMERRIEKELARQNAIRKKNNQPPRILKGKSVHDQAAELGLKWKNARPSAKKQIEGRTAHAILKAEVMKEYFTQINEALYTKFNKATPKIHVLVFQAKDNELPKSEIKIINEFTKFFGGKFKILKGLQAIK